MLRDKRQPQLYPLGKLARAIWPFFRPFWRKYSAAMGLLIATGLLSLLPPYLIKVLIDNGVRKGRMDVVNAAAIALIGIALVTGLSRGFMDYIHEWVSTHFIMRLRAGLFTRVLRQPIQFFSTYTTGDILGRLRADTTAVYSVLVNTFIGSVGEIIQVFGIAAFLFYLNWKLALVALGFIPLLHATLLRYAKPLRRLTLEVRDKDVGVLEFLQERVANVLLVKLYHREAAEEARHEKVSRDLIRSILASVRCRFRSVFLIGLLTSLAAIAVLWYGAYLVTARLMSVGSLFAFYLYVGRFYAPIQSLTNRILEIYGSLASAQRIAEFLELRPAVVESAHPVRLKRKGSCRIDFRDVDFGYRSESLLMRRLNLTIWPGQTVAIVGESGAGKTTLMNLLCRLYDVQGGTIALDGVDIRELAFEDLYNALAVVPQETLLFNASIEDNIRYGREDATPEQIVEAAKVANLHEFVARQPKRYKTSVGPRGGSLSGGQRQRLALARLVLKDAPVWILDEFTSALDSRSEGIVHENLMPLLRDRTVLIIAHRHSTIKSADMVVVLDNGAIQEIGTHDELYTNNGLYRRLFDTQLTADAYA
jgi:ATP-binding cassette subfamily B protein